MNFKDERADGLVTEIVEHIIVVSCKFPVVVGEKVLWILIKISPKLAKKIIKFPLELIYRLGLRFIKYGIKKLSPEVIQDIVEEETKIYNDYKKQNKLKNSYLGRTKLAVDNLYRELRGKKPIIIQETQQKQRKLNSPKALLDKFHEYRDYRNSYKKSLIPVKNKAGK